MKTKQILALFALFWVAVRAVAGVTIEATYNDKDGNETNLTADAYTPGSISGNAPLHVHFTYDATELETGASAVWHVRNTTAGINLTRYETDFDYDFTVSGLTQVILQVTVGNEVVEEVTVSVTVSESILEMPNAFSPNDDGNNDTYQAKSKSQSIVEFHAYIFNRWGQKLFDWTDWQDRKGGWNGTYNGRPVKDGVYYVYVKARGADGVEYNIRRDVNLIRNFNVTEGTTTE